MKEEKVGNGFVNITWFEVPQAMIADSPVFVAPKSSQSQKCVF